MTTRWQIRIEAWPHSTGKGADMDQRAAGDREVYFYVSADDIDEAARMARCFAAGMEHNPAVWRAPITGIAVYKEPQK